MNTDIFQGIKSKLDISVLWEHQVTKSNSEYKVSNTLEAHIIQLALIRD